MKSKQQNQIDKFVKSNDYDWYAVVYNDGDVLLRHYTALSNILQCGHDRADYGIAELHKCGNTN